MMSISGFLLGLINIAVVVVLLFLAGLLVQWFLKLFFSLDVPGQIQRMYVALVGLIALYMLIALLFGLPSWSPLSFRHVSLLTVVA